MAYHATSSNSFLRVVMPPILPPPPIIPIESALPPSAIAVAIADPPSSFGLLEFFRYASVNADSKSARKTAQSFAALLEDRGVIDLDRTERKEARFSATPPSAAAL